VCQGFHTLLRDLGVVCGKSSLFPPSSIFPHVSLSFLNRASKNPSFEAVATLRGAAVKKSNQGDSV
jgi:hypothetical protein